MMLFHHHREHTNVPPTVHKAPEMTISACAVALTLLMGILIVIRAKRGPKRSD